MVTDPQQRRVRLWAPVVAYMAAIFYLSSLENPPAPSGVPDVNLHAVAYFGLMLVVVRAVARGTWARVTVGTLAAAWIITVAYGATDEWSYNITENPVSVHDLHATVLHLLGIDHKRLTYKFQGRYFRLTDVHGQVVKPLLG